MPYISVELFTVGSGNLKSRGYIAPDTDPRLLVVIARDSLAALSNRGIVSDLLSDSQANLQRQLANWQLEVEETLLTGDKRS